MNRRPKLIRPLLALVALAAAVVVAARLRHDERRPERGRVLFIDRSAAPATRWRRPGPRPEIGPDLDDAFAAARESGDDRRHDRRRGQGAGRATRGPNNGNPAVSMPANIVEGQDLDDVAAYVGDVGRRARRGAARRSPAAPAPRSSPTTAAAAATSSPRPTPAAPPARTSTKSSPGQSRRRSTRTSSTRTKSSPRATRPSVMPPNFGETLSFERTRRPRPVPVRKHARRQRQIRRLEPRLSRGGPRRLRVILRRCENA